MLLSKKKLVIIIAVVLLAIGLCVGGFFIHRGKTGESVPTTEITEKQKETEKAEDPEEKINPSTLLRHAPNMYIDWSTEGNDYDAITIDWRCTEDALYTYWAVHNWENGYAGFQNLFGNHILLLSLWDLPDGTRPTVEYALGDYHGDFGGEGEGKHVYTDYDWQVNTWYSMKIERLYEDGKTYFTQYIKEEDGEWLKTASISYPVFFPLFTESSLFQEDFCFNNLRRSCEVKNAGGLIAGTDEWEMWKTCEISNSFFPTNEATWEDGVMNNVAFNCDYKNNGDSIWVQSGGYDDTLLDKTYPKTETIE